MRTRTRIGLIALAGAGLVVSSAKAESESFNCKMGNLVRQVEVRSGASVADLACQVLYRKQTEQPGVEEVLWSATSDATFCADKAQGLVDKLESHGWACEVAGGGGAEQEIVEARVPPELTPEPVPTLPAVAKPSRNDDPVLDAAIAQDLSSSRTPPRPRWRPTSARSGT